VAEQGGGELRSAVCSITKTARKRFFWAAWWTAAPHRSPFRRPDASNGGAKTEEEALAEAERTAGRHLVLIEPYWARAWNRVLRGEAPPPLPPPPGTPRKLPVRDPAARASSWSILGLEPGALPSAIRSAYKKRALETHPDQGGDADAFRDVQRAYERLRERVGPKRRS
jgi:hypothetical protein